MSNPSISNVLKCLRLSADNCALAWPTMIWDKISGPGPEQLKLEGNGVFPELELVPDHDVVLKTRLILPEELAAVRLIDDILEVTIFSLYPTELVCNGNVIFKDAGVPVASGPALVTVLPAIKAGDNGELQLTIHLPDNQMTKWFELFFTTPRLRARFEVLDSAWSELKFAHTLATTVEEQSAVSKAAALIPEDMDQFTSALLKQMEEELACLNKKAENYFVHVIGHSHIDMNWLWTWPDTVNVIHRDFKSVLNMMDDYPEMTFTHSQPATYEVIRQQAPELLDRVVEFIKQGRWEPATISWTEGDTNMASGEAMARHLLESAIFTRDILKTRASSFLAPDTFGHAGNLPQLAVSAGAQRYYHHRANPGQAKMEPAYWWEGQDGTRILAISTPSYNGNIRARDLVAAVLSGKEFGHNDSLHFHGIGDHGGGPARHNLEALRHFQQRPLLPKAQCSTLARYTQCLLDSGISLPIHYGESGTIFEGCYTTHADIKFQNRYGENMLCTADTLAAMAGLNLTDKLQEAWRTVLFNQFHDIFDGSGIHETYEQCALDFEDVSSTAKAVEKQALQILESGFPKGTIVVTNPLGWEREDWVAMEESESETPVQLHGNHGHFTIGQNTDDGFGFIARVPAYTTVSYTITDGSTGDSALSVKEAYAPNDHRDDNWLTDKKDAPPYYLIETPYFRIYMRRDSGILTSFYDKRVGRELVAFGMRKASDYMDTARADLALNVFQIEDEHPHGMSAWHMDEVHTTHSLLRGATTRILEEGSTRLIFEVYHPIRSSVITQKIIFYRDLARVDFKTNVDWQELGSPENGVPNLKVAFTAHLKECEAWFETPFGAVQRPCDGQEVPALRWVDVGGKSYGMSLLNDSKYGYDVLGTRMRLTLLRSGYEPDAISDIGEHDISFSFVPHSGDWRNAGIVRQAISFNQPLIARRVSSAGTAQAITWHPEIIGSSAIIPAAFKWAHDGSGLILRLYESQGQTAEIELCNLPESVQVWETSIIEERKEKIQIDRDRLQLTFRPWQVRTLLISD